MSKEIDQGAGNLPITFGNRYFVDKNGNGGDGSRKDFSLTSIETAYDNCLTNNEDQILLSTNSTHTLTEGLTWTKNRISVIGLGDDDRLVQQGAKIQLPDGETDAYVLKNTGNRNSFKNIKFIQASAEATALTVLQDGGEGSLYKNCSFVFSVADNLGGTTAHEIVAGSDSATFRECTFGNDTLLTSGARSVFVIDQVTSGQEFKSNIIKDCNFFISSSEAGAQFVSMAAAGDILFSNFFDNCGFIASLDSSGGVALTKAVSTANGTTKGALYFANPKTFGVTDFGTNGTNNDNLYVLGGLAVNTDLVALQPVAT